MRAAVLEGGVISPGDISWEPVSSQMETTIYTNTREEQKLERLADADAEVVLLNKLLMNAEVFERFPKIRYVGECATGYNNIDLVAAREHGVTVTYVPAYSTASVVQHTFALLLELTNKVARHDASVQQGEWISSTTFCYWQAPIIELANKTMGIVGYGNIGRGVAQVARALGMRVCVLTAHPERYRADESHDLRFMEQDEFLACSDVISLHCPLTDETRGFVCAETIEKMRDGVILLNLSRGPLVVEQDVVHALQTGKVSAAGFDVVSVEPMRADNPLLNAPHVVITPHLAWASVEARRRLIDIAAENLRKWREGTPINVVT